MLCERRSGLGVRGEQWERVYRGTGLTSSPERRAEKTTGRWRDPPPGIRSLHRDLAGSRRDACRISSKGLIDALIRASQTPKSNSVEGSGVPPVWPAAPSKSSRTSPGSIVSRFPPPEQGSDSVGQGKPVDRLTVGKNQTVENLISVI